MTRRSTKSYFQLTALALAMAAATQSFAQDIAEEALEDSTIVYSAEFFNEYSPVSVNDMISRIPGIGLALGNNRGGGNRRGLGSGENEVLINGQRMAGKNNGSRDALNRISANQVDYIEIIRGTSDQLDVRGGGQVVNIVLIDSKSRSSISAEANMDRLQDGTIDPGAKLSFNGQTGDLNYLFHIEADPGYDNRETFETSFDADGNLNETRDEETTREQTRFETSFNLGYRFERSRVQLNGLYGESTPEASGERTIIDYTDGFPDSSMEREVHESEHHNWEIGGDYEYEFNNGGKFRSLFIVNDRDYENTRDRYLINDDNEEKDLFIFSMGRDRERILRTSYTWDLASNQGLELGVEAAQTIHDSGFRLGVSGVGPGSPAHGGLIPIDIDNAFSTVEEIRYENFANHNWQINDKMALESTLIYEISTIEQTGDVSNKRDFDFVRPKVDYRYDLTQSVQLRATVEKSVSQLSFSDFSASSDNSDDDQNVQVGNPEIVQEQSWNYDLNLEYRLPNNVGVINTKLYYRDITDHIDRVDVSTEEDLASARGNIGDGNRYGLEIDTSTRLGIIGLPNALLGVGFTLQDSEVLDPFIHEDRRMRHNSRWFARTSFRHDITSWDFSYGFNYVNFAQDGGGRTTIDIEDIEKDKGDYGLSFFLEKKAFGGVTFRFDMQNANDPLRCRERYRFEGATVDGVIEEVENNCSSSGIKYSFRVRHTF